MASKDATINAARGLVKFINQAPSPYHVVDLCRKTLTEAGFVELSEKLDWKQNQLKVNGKYFLTRNQSTIIAFAVGGKYQPGGGFSIVGAHTDSPCLKVKPRSTKKSNGFLSVGVECYGGGIWNTWFDRDLTVAGRAIIKTGDKLVHQLVNIEQPILRVPHLAIHLQRDINDKFGPNKESHILPVLATAAMTQLNQPKATDEQASGKNNGQKCQAEKHHSVLIDAICNKLGCKKEDLLDMELCLADTQPSVIGGLMNEFVFSPRLDNLFNVYTGLQGLLESLKNDTLASESNIRMVVFYDNEEVGSESAQGAGSALTELVMRRIVDAIGGDSQYERTIANSYLISADQAHAVHPNYSEKHEENHKPAFHGGPVIKFNSNQKYATTAVTASLLRVVAEKADIPLQDVVVRNDSPCGSTIGPIISAKVGLRTVDIGGPMLSMHSIREMCCTSSVAQSISLYKAFFEEFSAVDASLEME
ncbi:aspartyl aminopeptidase-like [Rhopilema esculentum]|uniref:aspartyl aminopeptidase-like n=1 Tax=Rhopilema esculentum TaxID=499914 RepID=UPI0031D80DB9